MFKKVSQSIRRIPLQNWLVLILLAVSIFGFTESSPIFKTNQWDDTNVSFTMGRGWISGLWPYRDLFEQRGPIMYAIYALAAKISFNNFLGLFVIESALLFAGFFVLLKLAELAGFKQSKYTVAFFGLALFYGSNVFGFGGSPEELVFPLTAWFIYNVLRDFQHDQFPKVSTMLINGILFSIVFWIKFSLIGYFVGYYVAYGLYLLFKRCFKNFFKILSLSLIGFAIPSVIIIAVFAAGHASNALFKVYFVTNLTMYGNTISAAGKFFTIFKSMGGDLISHPFTAAMIVIWLLILSTQFRKKAHVFYIFASMIGLQFLTVYLSGNTQWYYLLAAVTFVAVLLPNSLGFLINNFNLKIGKINFTRLDVLMIIIGFLLLNGGNTNLRTALFKGQQINPVASVKFGEYMREHYTGSKPTLIEYN
ncbi:hypothetical protein [Secundilactobacillus yichangensis]|uniref:hypothetical protein n=1 Tax=Secundilactobacillus yichangensis TaxID=2799580 RepID=UPI0019411984|nr:hypothetical protein [Secundilactobacillus yichangensis]